MTGAPITPSSDELSGLTAMIQFAKDFAGTIFGGGGIALAWRAGSRLKEFEGEQATLHAAREDHHERIKALEAASKASEVRIAALPTRDEIAGYFSRLEMRLDNMQSNRRQD